MTTYTRKVQRPGRVDENGVNGNGNGAQPPERFRKRRRGFRISRHAKESLALGLVWYVVYAAIGLRVTVGQHVVVFDALSRLAHAYFVWYNSPPKLAAIGFVWPPVATIVFLPLAVIRPLATSTAALALTSALFAAGTLVLMNRLFELVRMQRWMRWPLVAAYGLNPMIVFYAGNGMSEAVYMFFLVAAAYWLLRWYLIRQPRPLLLAAIAFAFGILSRYEVLTWALVATVALVLILMRQRVSRAELEGSLIAYLAPISYAVGVWVFFNWLIIGDPLFFLRNQAPGGTTGPGGLTHASVTVGAPGRPLASVAASVFDLNASLFPFAVLVTIALFTLFVVRRNVMSLTLFAFMVVNALFTVALIYESHAPGYTQLRYNMRAMPLSLVGVAWLYFSVRPRLPRLAVWGATLACLVVTVPVTWQTMKTYPQQYLEQAFTRAIATGRDQEGTSSTGGYGVGIGPQRLMARYVDRHVHSRNAILTDDAQTFSVMLLSGRPDLFWDRIDRGDGDWIDVRDDPWGRVRFLLVSDNPNDLIRIRFPAIFASHERGLTPVYRVQSLELLRVAARPPGLRDLPSGI